MGAIVGGIELFNSDVAVGCGVAVWVGALAVWVAYILAAVCVSIACTSGVDLPPHAEKVRPMSKTITRTTFLAPYANSFGAI